VESDQVPAGLDGVTMMMLVDRRSGKGFGITLYDCEEAMRRCDAALNAMEGGGQRLSVEFFEVPVTDNRSMRATERRVK
jgi:exopolysaccharide biosynthesis protein